MTESYWLLFLNILECDWFILEESQYQFLFWIGYFVSLATAFIAGYEMCCRKHKNHHYFLERLIPMTDFEGVVLLVGMWALMFTCYKFGQIMERKKRKGTK